MAISALGLRRSFALARQGHKTISGTFLQSQNQALNHVHVSSSVPVQSMSTFVNNTGNSNNPVSAF